MKEESLHPRSYEAEMKKQEDIFRTVLLFIRQKFGEQMMKVALTPSWNSRTNPKEPTILLFYNLSLQENLQSDEIFTAFHNKLNQLYRGFDFSSLISRF